MIIIFIPLISIPLFILAYASNYVFTDSAIQKTTVNVEGESKLIVTRIQESIQNAEHCANILTVNLNKVIAANDSSVKDDFTIKELDTRIANQLSLDLLFFPDVEAAAFVDMDNRLHTTNYKMADGLQEAFQSEIFRKTNATNAENVWFTMEARDFLTTDKGTPVLTLGKKILSIDTGDQLGTLILIVKESSFSAIYQSVERGQERKYQIVDASGQVISSLNKEELLKMPEMSFIESFQSQKNQETDVVEWQGQRYLATSTPFNKLNWRLVSEIPLRVLTEDNRKMAWLIAVLGLFGIVFSYVGASILAKVIADPLLRLTKTMQRVKEGDLNIRFEMSSTDEVGFLAFGFNKMLGQIRELLHQVGSEQKQKLHYELALVQSQIKPHFLYNTLDLVYVLCAMNRVSEARDATKALADFYRVVLSGGREVITIAEEFDNVSNYLAIQSVRYIDVFTYDIQLDEGIARCEIPKLTIQPLVENAIYHGLKPRGDNGRLHITGRRMGDDIEIEIADNGIGMTEETSKKLLTASKRELRGDSFGLLSVHERIKLFFGQEYGVSIYSEFGNGTTVRVKLPFIRTGEDNDV